MPVEPEKHYHAWLKKASEDELSAHAVLREGAPSTGCFLSQQVAEKCLTALLVYHNLYFPRVHDLIELETLLVEREPELRMYHEDLEVLNRYYVEPRYPADVPEFTRSECQKALEAALRIKEFVSAKIKSSKPTSGFGTLGILVTAAAVLVLIGGGYLIYQRFAKPVNIVGTVCTQEVKLCPDGSYVSRTGPNCEFAECPASSPPQGTEIDTSGWKTYRNEKYGFEVRYPATLRPSEYGPGLVEGKEVLFAVFFLHSNPILGSAYTIRVNKGFLTDERNRWKAKALFLEEQLRINGNNFTVFSYEKLPPRVPEDFPGTYKIVAIEQGRLLYVLSFMPPSPVLETYRAVLSTFEFIK